MSTSVLSRYMLGVCVSIFFMPGCGGWQTQAGTAAPALPREAATAQFEPGLQRGASSGGDLVYVSSNYTYFFTFPGGTFVGDIDYAAFGMCSDGNGDVFLSSEDITEFAHGGAYPINILKPVSGFGANGGCSIDPTTGNLAATVPGGIEVYKNAEGTPTVYKYPAGLNYCGYDDAGNLFVDGYTGEKHRKLIFLLAELPKGGRALIRSR